MPLEALGWHVRHDVFAEHGNRDHVVVGPSGVYLLDTKTPAGLVRVEGDVMVVDRTDNLRASYRLDRLVPGLRAEAARLKVDLEVTAGRTWVQAVVVIWADFPQRIIEGDRVVFVHGDELVAWLRERPVVLGEHRTVKLTEAVRALRAAA